MQKYSLNDFKDSVAVLKRDLKEFEQFKPTEGVSFKVYDRYGLERDPKVTGEDTAFDYRDYIADENDNEGFQFVSADKQQLEKARAMMA